MQWLVIAEVAGGVVLFLIGMQAMSAGLRAAAGDRLRTWLNAATASRWRGLALGTSVGFLAHSSAASVMTIGFVHAGVLSLAASLPVLFGANVGTTLSMQLVSLRLTDYALVAVVIGGIAQLTCGEGIWRHLGRAVLGFGLIFLGMRISGDAIVPYRETLAGWLANFDAATVSGLMLGVLASLVVTVAVQSSGAVIGMGFVLASSGVLSSLAQTYPIVLGAHIGTTSTALIASLGATSDARRAALANLLFNIVNVSLGVIAARWLIPMLEHTSPDLVHQTANAHTAVMVLGVVVMLPLTGVLRALLCRMVGGKEPDRPGSFLDMQLMDDTPAALGATRNELGRCARICADSFSLVNGAFHARDRRALRRATADESSVDEIKASVRAYLATLSSHDLSWRDVLMAQSFNRIAIELERISDHIESLGVMVRRGAGAQLCWLNEQTNGQVLRLSESAGAVVDAVVHGLQTVDAVPAESMWPVVEARNRYNRAAVPVKTTVREQLARAKVPADVALVFSEYTAVLDRIVRHCTIIAQELRQPSVDDVEAGPGK